MMTRLFSMRTLLFSFICATALLCVFASTASAEPMNGTDQPSTVAPTSAGNDFVPLVRIQGLNDMPGLTSTAGVAQFLNNIYLFAIGLSVALAVIMIIWGGTEYALSEAITSKGAGKKKIQQALYGLLLVLSPALVFSIVNPEILNLNVRIPALKTAWGDYTSAKNCNPDTDPTCISAGGLGNYQTGTAPISCTSVGTGGSYDCAAEIKQCKDTVPPPSDGGKFYPIWGVQCQKPDGTIDTNGRSDWRIFGWTNYSCGQGQRLIVTCGYSSVPLM